MSGLRHSKREPRARAMIWSEPHGNVRRVVKPGLLVTLLQNIPKPENDLFLLRKAFICDPGHILIVADYKTMEMRIMAHYSQCESLIQVIREGRDLHSETAARMFDIEYEEILWAKKNEHNMDLSTAERGHVMQLVRYRSIGKTTGFGTIFGMQAKGLAKKLGCSVPEAESMLDTFFSVYPGVKRFMYNIVNVCRSRAPTPYVQTWLLRKRRLLSINSPDRKARSEDERKAFNAPIQGTAADMVVVAMLACESDPVLHELEAEMLMQVHDELIFQAPEANREPAMERIQEKMEAPFRGVFSVEFPVEIGWGYNWAAAK